MAATEATQLDYFRRIWQLRHFWFSLVLNDIRSRYRRSILGVGWSMLRPLGMTTVFCVVFGSIFQKDIRDYAPFVLLGMTTWQFLSEAINQGCHSFTMGAAYIRQQKVPHAIFPLRSVLASAFHFAVALCLGVVLTIAFKGLPSVAHLAFLPFAFVILFVLAWSFSILAGVTATHFPDTTHLLEIVLQILFYLTPIMYDPKDFPQRATLARVLAWNPFHALLDLVRVPLLEGQAPSGEAIGLSVAFVSVVALCAWTLLRRLERTLVFWL